MRKPLADYDDILGRVEKYIYVEGPKEQGRIILTRRDLRLVNQRKGSHTLTSQNGISSLFLNYTLGKLVGEKVVQMLEGDCTLGRPRSHARRSLA